MATFTRTHCSGPPADAKPPPDLSPPPLLHAPACAAGAGAVDDRDRRRRRDDDPDLDRPVRERGHVAARHHRHRRRRSRPLGPVSSRRLCRHHATAGAARGSAGRRLARARRGCGRGGVDAGPAGRAGRGALRAGRRDEGVGAREPGLHGRARAVSRHRAPHRRRDLRETDRRAGRVLDAHRLHHQAGLALLAAGRRRRRPRSADDRLVERADPVAALGARRLAHRLRVARAEEAGGLRAVARHGWTPGGRELPRQQQRARVVAGWPHAWPSR